MTLTEPYNLEVKNEAPLSSWLKEEPNPNARPVKWHEFPSNSAEVNGKCCTERKGSKKG